MDRLAVHSWLNAKRERPHGPRSWRRVAATAHWQSGTGGRVWRAARRIELAPYDRCVSQCDEATIEPGFGCVEGVTDATLAILVSEPLEPIAAVAVRASDFVIDPVGSSPAAIASFVDTKAAVTDNAWLAGLLIALTTFVLLLVMFRSVVVALKAIALNLLSLGATFGMMVWIFQDGNGAGLLGVTATGQTDITTPILMFCIAFGLSMDYEVFLLARIKEEWDRTGDNVRRPIITGLAATGRLVSNAAVSCCRSRSSSFALTSNVSTITLFGLGLAVADVRRRRSSSASRWSRRC